MATPTEQSVNSSVRTRTVDRHGRVWMFTAFTVSLTFVLLGVIVGVLRGGSVASRDKVWLMVAGVPMTTVVLMELGVVLLTFAPRVRVWMAYRLTRRPSLENAAEHSARVWLRGTVRTDNHVETAQHARCVGYVSRHGKRDDLGAVVRVEYETRSTLVTSEFHSKEHGILRVEGGDWEIVDPFEFRVIDGECRVQDGDTVLFEAVPTREAMSGAGYREVANGFVLRPANGRVYLQQHRTFGVDRYATYAWGAALAVSFIVMLVSLANAHSSRDRQTEAQAQPKPVPIVPLAKEGEVCGHVSCGPELYCVPDMLRNTVSSVDSRMGVCERLCRTDADCSSGKWCLFQSHDAGDHYCEAPETMLPIIRLTEEYDRGLPITSPPGVEIPRSDQ